MSNLDNIRSTRELMLICTFFQGALVQELYVYSFNKDERAQIPARHRNIQDSQGFLLDFLKSWRTAFKT